MFVVPMRYLQPPGTENVFGLNFVIHGMIAVALSTKELFWLESVFFIPDHLFVFV